jgi:acetoacetyl-CoA synthetase
MWKMAQDEKITIFGTSAGYLTALEAAGRKPGEEFDLSPLQTLCSTGSPLSADSFRFVYRDIKEDVCLSSIAGGTDLNGCFAIGNPMLPVYIEELQCRALAMDVDALDADGNSVVGVQGELVCKKAFPSMPLHFWNDPDEEKYMDAYFRRFPGIWHHGDFITVTEHGGIIMYGRSDATLNPGGVRIGTAEIYNVVENMPEVADSLVIGQDWESDVRVVLFVKLAEGVELDEDLQKKIKNTIRANASPRHMPAKIIPIGDVPYTINMKKVELAVKNVIHGKPVLNRDALRNPEALELYEDLEELKR